MQEQDARTGWTSNQSYHIPPETFRKLVNLIYMSYFDKYEMCICHVMGNVIRVVVFTLSIIHFLFSRMVSVKGWDWILP